MDLKTFRSYDGIDGQTLYEEQTKGLKVSKAKLQAPTTPGKWNFLL
jgi:hypothetical protein